MDFKTEYESCVSFSIQYVNLDEKQRNFIDSCLKSINSNEEGKTLIVFLTKKLTEINCSVQIKTGNKQVFKTPKEGGAFTLFLNFGELSVNGGVKAPCLGLISEDEFIPIGESTVPFHIVLGHELLHVKHYLEDKKQYDIDSARMKNYYWPIYDMDYRLENLWHDQEEQRTVIGRMDSPETCELILRMQDKIAPRYAYQDSKDHFYEDKSIIGQILSVYKPNNSNDLTRDSWAFNKEIASKSRLNSEIYKKMNANLYEEKVEELKNEVKMFNEDQLSKQKAMLKKLEERAKKQ
jgi:hypothetical protein